MVYKGIWGDSPAIASRATIRDSAGPIINTIKRRAACMDTTKGISTLLEAAIMAAVSIPPGLVAR